MVEIMSCELALDDIVTEFLLNTCRRCPPSTSTREHAVQAAVYCGVVATVNDEDTERIPLTTGSLLSFTLNRYYRISVILT